MATQHTTQRPAGREFEPRESVRDAGTCADCGKHVDPNDPELYTRLTSRMDVRTDEQGLRDDEELAVRGSSTSMGGETLDDSPGRRLEDTRAPATGAPRRDGEESVNADAAVWDGSCYHCGAAPDRVGRLAAS